MDKELSQKLEKIKTDIHAEIQAKTLEILQSSKEDLSKSIGEVVTTAIENNRHVLFSQSEKGRWWWVKDALQIFVPSIATIGAVFLGYIIWGEQAKITQSLSEKEKNFAIQLSLKQKYTDKRFDAYSQIDELLYKLLRAAKAVDEVTNSRGKRKRLTKFADVVKNYIETSELKKMYMSEEVFKRVFTLVTVYAPARDTRGIERTADEIRKLIKYEFDNPPSTKVS